MKRRVENRLCEDLRRKKVPHFGWYWCCSSWRRKKLMCGWLGIDSGHHQNLFSFSYYSWHFGVLLWYSIHKTMSMTLWWVNTYWYTSVPFVNAFGTDIVCVCWVDSMSCACVTFVNAFGTEVVCVCWADSMLCARVLFVNAFGTEVVCVCWADSMPVYHLLINLAQRLCVFVGQIPCWCEGLGSDDAECHILCVWHGHHCGTGCGVVGCLHASQLQGGLSDISLSLLSAMHMHAHVYACTHTHTHACMCMHTCMHSHAFIHKHMHAQYSQYSPTHTLTHTHTNTTYTHTH